MPWDDTFQGLVKGAIPGLDDQMASVGLVAGDTVAPTLEDLGLNSLGETVRQWGYDTYRENKKEAAEEEKKYPRPKSVEEELREADDEIRTEAKEKASQPELEVNEVEAVIKNLSAAETKGQYKEKEGVVIRYFDNQYIPFDQYKHYKL